MRPCDVLLKCVKIGSLIERDGVIFQKSYSWLCDEKWYLAKPLTFESPKWSVLATQSRLYRSPNQRHACRKPSVFSQMETQNNSMEKNTLCQCCSRQCRYVCLQRRRVSWCLVVRIGGQHKTFFAVHVSMN